MSWIELVLSALGKSLVPVLLKKLTKPAGALLRWRPPLSDRRLGEALGRKYHDVRFLVEHSRTAFYERIAKELISTINREVRNRQESPYRVGVICGPMVYNVADAIIKRRLVRSDLDFTGVQFVAMNKAAEREAFQYAASYLVTLLSSAFRGSRPVAYTFNDYDRAALDDARKSIDLLLCSVGTNPFGPESYLKIWCRNAKELLPDDCVGDFCLRPIDSDGHAAGPAGLKKRIEDCLDPYPTFTRLSDLAKGSKKTLILPINVEPFDKKSAETAGSLTGKETIAETVLHSGIVRVSILERPLATNLLTAIGGYVIEAASPHTPGAPIRVCLGRHFREPDSRKRVLVYDRNDRLSARRIPATKDDSETLCLECIPDIILSEDEAGSKHYDHEHRSGAFEFTIASQRFRFSLHRGVRPPGSFSRLTLQLAYKAFQQIEERDDREISLWDLGCGSGVVGVVAAKLFGKRRSLVLCSDISEDAVACTAAAFDAEVFDRNLFEVRRCDLFGALPADGKPRTFDIIAFNPPFLPRGLVKVNPIDWGGARGVECAERFARDVSTHLRSGRYAILALTDYVDNGSVGPLLRSSFGDSNVSVHETVISFPRETENRVPAAYEVKFQREIENACGYRFELCELGGRQYIAFRVRHYVAEKAAA